LMCYQFWWLLSSRWRFAGFWILLGAGLQWHVSCMNVMAVFLIDIYNFALIF
jgi:hypothetical protein